MSIPWLKTEDSGQADTNSGFFACLQGVFVCLNNSAIFPAHLFLYVIKKGCNYILWRTFQHTLEVLIGNLHL